MLAPSERPPRRALERRRPSRRASLRLLVSLIAVSVAFGFCFWQNHPLLRLIDTPLAHQTQQQVRDGHGPLEPPTRSSVTPATSPCSWASVARGASSPKRDLPGQALAVARRRGPESRYQALSTPPQGDRPVTLGIGEPFTTTVTVSLIFALIISLPVLLFQGYGFLMPVFAPEQRRRCGRCRWRSRACSSPAWPSATWSSYPRRVHFFQNFNSTQFNVLVQASQYYKFAATTILAMGLLFQVPVAILAITRAGIITPRQLGATAATPSACVLIAALLPAT